MTTPILLTSAAFVREATAISDAISDEYLLPSIREAQELRYKRAIGSRLLGYMKTNRDTLDGAYKTLLDMSQYYLAFQAVALLLPKVQYKVTNAGVVKTSDDNITPVTPSELAAADTFWQSKADAELHEIERWICHNRQLLPELDGGTFETIKSNLHTSASCGIFLGGARGKNEL